MSHSSALPFNLRRSQDILGAAAITTITETVHGLLHLEGDRITIQWRLSRKTQLVGSEIRTDEEMEAIREVVIPLEAVASASVRRGWWGLGRTRVVLTAADLRAFEDVSGEGGLRLSHPAELVVRVEREHRLAAEEFTAELTLARAELLAGMDRSLGVPDGTASGPVGRDAHALGPGAEEGNGANASSPVAPDSAQEGAG